MRKLLAKESNFRVPKVLNFDRAKQNLTQAIDEFIAKITNNDQAKTNLFKKWKEKILVKVQEKENEKLILDIIHDLKSRFLMIQKCQYM